MISINKPIKDNLRGFELKDNFDIENSMVIFDGQEVAGITYYTPINSEEAIIDEVLIKPSYRHQYFGDSIVKAILNVADKRGVRRMFVNTNKDNKQFFNKVGFIDPDFSDVKSQYSIDENTLIAILPDFFNTACRSKK